jgi:hypothetical protein
LVKVNEEDKQWRSCGRPWTFVHANETIVKPLSLILLSNEKRVFFSVCLL